MSLTKGVDGGGQADISVLTVHVVGTTSRVVFDPNTVILDVSGVLLSDLSPQRKI
jgi:hypothetical protein